MLKCTKQHDLGFILHSLLYSINGHIRIRLQKQLVFLPRLRCARERLNEKTGTPERVKTGSETGRKGV